ncbi:uncharacterized protein LOC131212775 [Anopheles bellator]|uniref:uncharacterized protein LOC131212775 n=1 Tax=Anopheles bellator TaxID=139047 RepID=UPI002647E410|nr:uncharacterized protein LOC131212775 [Anopheles bellator]
MEQEKWRNLWKVSREFLEKQIGFSNTIHQAMLEKVELLEDHLFQASEDENNQMPNIFKESYEELLTMSKAIQNFVCDWQKLLLLKSNATKQQFLQEEPAAKPMPDYMKPLTKYEPNQAISLLIVYIPPSLENVAYAMDIEENDVKWCEHLQNEQKSIITKLPSAGTVFCVLLDGFWFRAVRNSSIVSNNIKIQDQNKSFLYMLDTGETVSYDDTLTIAELPSSYQNKPSRAMRCRIRSDVRDPAFKQFDVLECRVISIDENNILNVEVQHNPEKAAPVEERNPLQNPTKEELEQWHELPESTTNATKALLGYVPKDDATICKFYNPRTRRCFKGSNCRLRHIERDPDGWTLDKDTIVVDVKAQMEIPQPNTRVKLHPTFVDDVNLFYANIVPECQTIRSDIASLHYKLNDPDSVARYKEIKRFPCAGELVLALYENDWYRAKVMDFFEDNTAYVFYVDYGNTATVSMSELRLWEERFSYVPYLAVGCTIANAQRVKECHIEAIVQLQNVLLDKKIDALIINNDSLWEVQIFDEDGCDIGQCLVDTHLALPRQPTEFDINSALPG